MKSKDSNYHITSRAFRTDEDFSRVRDLLVETFPITPTGFNWEVRRWDGFRYYNANSDWNPSWGKRVRLWATTAGRVVGAVVAEGPGGADLQLHPDYRHLEEDIITWAEENLIVALEDGHNQLTIFVFEYDVPRRRLLDKRGYDRLSKGGFTYRLRLGERALQRRELADSYSLRTVRPYDDGDCAQLAALLNAAFNRDFHVPGEFRTFGTHAESYREDCDFVAVAPDGSFASYVGAPYDETNQCGIIEPVCTHPDHLRRGLAHTLILEAVHRLREIGATDVLLCTGDREAANRLYEAVGFTEAYRGYYWRKVF